MRFENSKPFFEGIYRVFSFTIMADTAGRDLEGPNPFLKAFIVSFPLQLGPVLQDEISKV